MSLIQKKTLNIVNGLKSIKISDIIMENMEDTCQEKNNKLYLYTFTGITPGIVLEANTIVIISSDFEKAQDYAKNFGNPILKFSGKMDFDKILEEPHVKLYIENKNKFNIKKEALGKEQFLAGLKLASERFIKTKKDKKVLLQIISKIK